MYSLTLVKQLIKVVLTTLDVYSASPSGCSRIRNLINISVYISNSLKYTAYCNILPFCGDVCGSSHAFHYYYLNYKLPPGPYYPAQLQEIADLLKACGSVCCIWCYCSICFRKSNYIIPAPSRESGLSSINYGIY